MAERARAWALRYLAPPRGVEARRLLAWMMLAVGIPRLPLLAHVLAFSRFRVGEPEVFGVVLTTVGVLLLITCYRWRLSLFGRGVAALAFVCWVTLAAVTLSVTSFLIDIGLAACALAEIWTLHDE